MDFFWLRDRPISADFGRSRLWFGRNERQPIELPFVVRETFPVARDHSGVGCSGRPSRERLIEMNTGGMAWILGLLLGPVAWAGEAFAEETPLSRKADQQRS